MVMSLASGALLLSSPPTTGASLFLAILGVVILAARFPLIRETTLKAAWFWGMLALLIVASGEILIYLSAADGASPWAGAIRFIAATATFCPVISVLGAQRPQNRSWPFIVFSLWFIAALPAGKTLLLPNNLPFEIHTAWVFFLAILVAIGIGNMLLTRYWFSALLFAAGQLALLADCSPWRPPSLGASGVVLGLLLIDGALVWAFYRSFRSGKVSSLDRLWLDFRDNFGVLWALRVAERINAAAEKNGWGFELTWRGFRQKDGSSISEPLPAETEAALRQLLANLLRRFVSSDWIAARWKCERPASGQSAAKT